MSFYIVPQSSDNPTNSQPQFLSNFGTINTKFSQNHVPLTQNNNGGYHTQLFFNGPVADPNLGAPYSSLYTKNAGSSNELFFQNSLNNIYQLTNLTVQNTGTNYGITTPWGITFNFGSATGNAPVTYKVPFVVAGSPYSVLVTPSQSTNVLFWYVTTSLTQLTPHGLSGLTYFYLAIGK